ncbi:hypothetical protein [Halocella sp. SP3-1]|uniref:hypothetical protein n=1 Tax=Halocella sp. SP3-1 TaxID=2382161 RepID=UPI000F7646FC|nr:hypothetical protein [Halocella sp. SP3-1]AZO95264.1 hypothetical protein D7D81_12055 [Halocella sp. SP3-1]
MSNDYYNKVVHDFVNYREYKQRCEYIEKTANNIPSWVVAALADRGMGIDYSKERVQTSNQFDPTSTAVLEAVEDNFYEYIEKIKLVKNVELAFKGLDSIEQFIMKHKYMTGEIINDVDVYTHPESPVKKTKYYEKKDPAVKKAARIIGYLEKN